MIEDEDTEIGVSDDERVKRKAVLQKATAKSLEKNWQDQDRAEIDMREKNIAPPVITESRCKVCTSPYRAWIESQLIKGRSYEAIANQTPPDEGGGKPSRKSVSNHYKEHMAIDRQIIRAELEEEAELIRQNVETGVKGALTTRGMLNTMVRKAWEDNMNGITTAEVKDVVQMMKLMNEMNANEGQIKNEEAEQHVRIFMMAIQNICTPELREAIVVEVKRLREMDDIDYEMEAHLVNRPLLEVPEAEIVNDKEIPDS